MKLHEAYSVDRLSKKGIFVHGMSEQYVDRTKSKAKKPLWQIAVEMVAADKSRLGSAPPTRKIRKRARWEKLQLNRMLEDLGDDAIVAVNVYVAEALESI